MSSELSFMVLERGEFGRVEKKSGAACQVVVRGSSGKLEVLETAETLTNEANVKIPTFPLSSAALRAVAEVVELAELQDPYSKAVIAIRRFDGDQQIGAVAIAGE